MKILIFEWLTSGGLWHDRRSPDSDSSIQAQGRQMLQAITEDFLNAGVEVVLPIDGRLENKIVDHTRLEKRPQWATDDLSTNLAELAEQVDRVMLVAPESQSCLLNCLQWTKSFGSKLISPDAEFARIASNKQTTCDYLRANGFESVPQGINYSDFQSGHAKHLVPPVVLKPIDGAGSEEVQLITEQMRSSPELSRSLKHYWLEPFVVGTPVSVSILCGPRRTYALPPTRQLFDQEPFGNYVGAGYPLEPDLAMRATQLAKAAIAAMPPTRGYVGFDIVLSDGSAKDDCLIEINPRLTTSYLKLREVCRENLAKLMLAIATGS